MKNAVKAGEVYRYYVWNTEDESDPFKNVDGVRKEMAVNNKAQFEEKYGVTIRYVLSAGGDDWYATPFASASAGTPMTDIFNAGGSYVTLLAYTYNGSAGVFCCLWTIIRNMLISAIRNIGIRLLRKSVLWGESFISACPLLWAGN